MCGCTVGGSNSVASIVQTCSLVFHPTLIYFGVIYEVPNSVVLRCALLYCAMVFYYYVLCHIYIVQCCAALCNPVPSCTQLYNGVSVLNCATLYRSCATLGGVQE